VELQTGSAEQRAEIRWRIASEVRKETSAIAGALVIAAVWVVETASVIAEVLVIAAALVVEVA